MLERRNRIESTRIRKGKGRGKGGDEEKEGDGKEEAGKVGKNR